MFCLLVIWLIDFQKHYYSPLCLTQFNKTAQRELLLEQFHKQAQMTSQANVPLGTDTGIGLPSFLFNSSSFSDQNNSDTFSISNQSRPQLGWNDVIYESLLLSGPPNFTLFASSPELSPSQYHHPGGVQYNNLTSSLPVPVANATTLATIVWSQSSNGLLQNLTSAAMKLIFSDLQAAEDGICRRETSLLFLLLMLGTVWMAVSLFNFNKTYLCTSVPPSPSINRVFSFPLPLRPYLQASKRELLADYALPCSVIILSFIGSYVFRDIPGKPLL